MPPPYAKADSYTIAAEDDNHAPQMSNAKMADLANRFRGCRTYNLIARIAELERENEELDAERSALCREHLKRVEEMTARIVELELKNTELEEAYSVFVASDFSRIAQAASWHSETAGTASWHCRLQPREGGTTAEGDPAAPGYWKRQLGDGRKLRGQCRQGDMAIDTAVPQNASQSSHEVMDVTTVADVWV